nr:unnamed protein product [Callosobruchus analis]
MGRSTVASIVKEMTRTLWNILQPIHMPVSTEATFRQISDDFMQTWNFPRCIGAIDRKHIKIKAQQHSGSMYFNYKHHFYIVLQGVCDANCKLIMIDVGGYSKQSDGADAAYPLMTNLLKPYSRNHLTLENLNFNQRLSRARKTIECTFGIMVAKWRLLSKPIETHEKTADDMIKAICILHNTILDREGFQRHLRVVTTNAVSKDNVLCLQEEGNQMKHK